MRDTFELWRAFRKDKKAVQEKAHELSMPCGFSDCEDCYPSEPDDEEVEEIIIPE